jgi:hypothetical protein
MEKKKFKCIMCGCDSECDMADKYSTDIPTYAHSINLCGEKCFFNMPRHRRNLLSLDRYIDDLLEKEK